MATAVEQDDTSEDPDLLAAEWDLEPLVGGGGEAGLTRLLDDADTRAAAFAGAYTGRVAELDSDGLIAAVGELEEIRKLLYRARCYAELRFAADTSDPAHGALLQGTEERRATIEPLLLFFDLEWIGLEDAQADALLEAAGEPVGFPAHHLRRIRASRRYRLSAREERVLAETVVTRLSAWQRMYNESSAALRVELDGVRVPVETAMCRFEWPDRDVRRAAADAVAVTLADGIDARAFCLNMVLGEKAVDDRLRGYPHWLARRHLENEASDEEVRALLHAVGSRHDIPRRWNRLKARLLGIDRLASYDVMAPVAASVASTPYGKARALVIDAYSCFSPTAGAIVRRFFEEPWIDAPPRPGKRGGAFCEPAVPELHPYLLLNYSGTPWNVTAIAHELGHGLHSVLARETSFLEQEHPPMTVAETASTFGEALVFEYLLAAATDARTKLELYGSRLNDTIRTIYETVAASNFEHLVHTHRRGRGELSVAEFTDAWTKTNEEVFGDSIDAHESARLLWSWIPHFVNYPGYVYAYSFGSLLALSAYRRYQQNREQFVPDFLAMLAAGASRSPQQLAQMIGVDLADPGFCNAGLELLDEQLRTAEALAAGLDLI